jgi:hypothetical protein
MEVDGVFEIGIVCGTLRRPDVIRVESVGFYDRLLGRTKADLVRRAIDMQAKKAERLNWWERAAEDYVGAKANASVGED